MKKVNSPIRVKVVYRTEEINTNFDKAIEDMFRKLDLIFTGSGYNFETKERDLGFAKNKDN